MSQVTLFPTDHWSYSALWRVCSSMPARITNYCPLVNVMGVGCRILVRICVKDLTLEGFSSARFCPNNGIERTTECKREEGGVNIEYPSRSFIRNDNNPLAILMEPLQHGCQEMPIGYVEFVNTKSER